MPLKITFAAPKLPKTGVVAVAVTEGGKLSPSAQALDKATGGALSRAIKGGRFSGKKGQSLDLVAPGGLGNSRVVMFGLGKTKAPEDLDLENLGGSLVGRLNGTGESELAILFDALGDLPFAPAECAARAALGARLRAYRFDKYKTKEKPESKPSLKTLTCMAENQAAARRAFTGLQAVAEGGGAPSGGRSRLRHRRDQRHADRRGRPRRDRWRSWRARSSTTGGRWRACARASSGRPRAGATRPPWRRAPRRSPSCRRRRDRRA